MSDTKTIRQGIITDEMVISVFRELFKLPGEVCKASDLLVDAELEQSTLPVIFKEIEDRQAELEREATWEVKEKIGDKGKPLYTNEGMRNVAMMTELSKNPEYIRAKNDMMAAKKKKADIENHIGKVRNQMYYIKNQQEVYLAVANLIAGLCQENVTSGQLEQIAKIKHLIEEFSHE